MSDTLQFLRETGDSAGTAAQSFLNKKLAENKYSATPDIDYDKGILDKDVAAHNASVADPYAMGEGTVASGPAYPQSGKSVQPANPRGEVGSWNAEQYKENFGLEAREGIGDNYNKGATDSDGTKSNPLLGKGYLSDDDVKRLKNDKKFQELYMEHGSNADRIKDGDYSFDEMSVNHMDGFLDKFGGELKDTLENKKEEGRKPIKHSPEIRQAKSRIKQYEESVMSGEMSNSIFQNANASDGGAKDYRFEATEGLDGIGTEGGVMKDDKSATSTASFLDKKKQDVKTDYNFRPAS